MKLVIKLNGYNVKINVEINEEGVIENSTCLEKFNSHAAAEFNSASGRELDAAIWKAYDAEVKYNKDNP